MGTNNQSILTTVKRTLNLAEDYTYFDQDVITHINSVFGTLWQLGIGPSTGFEIENKDSIWSEFMDDDLTLSPVKSYMYLRVRVLFDSPANSWTLDAMQEQIKELEWRLNVVREDVLLPSTPEEIILEGGGP